MRIAVVVAAIAMASSSSHASSSCMTQAEARRHFGAVHLYWHPPGRCWDANPGQRRPAQRSRVKEPRQVQRDTQQENKPSGWNHEPRWREAMSEMLPDDAARMLILARAQMSSEPVETPSPGTNWLDRWVDVVQRAPPIVDKSGPADHAPAASRNAEHTVAPTSVILAFLAVLLALAAIEIVFRTTIHDWRR